MGLTVKLEDFKDGKTEIYFSDSQLLEDHVSDSAVDSYAMTNGLGGSFEDSNLPRFGAGDAKFLCDFFEKQADAARKAGDILLATRFENYRDYYKD